MNDPRNIWKNQTTEAFKMSADELHRKSQQRQRKARFVALYSIIVGLILFVFCAWTFARVHNEVVPRIGVGVMSLWGIYYAYWAYKWFWRERLAPDAALNTTVPSYRSELEQRRDYDRHIWRRMGLAMVIVPGLIKSLDAPRLLLSFVPFFVLFAIWCAIYFPMRKRGQQKLQQEIEELRVFERENRS